MTSTESKSAALRAMDPRRLCVIGAGYVGLTAAVGFAELGHEVRCLEADEHRLAVLSAGRVPIHEPGIAELLGRQLAGGQLEFTGDVERALEGTDVAFLCVGTPPRHDGDPDLRQLAAAAAEVAAAARGDLVLVVKSTVPPGSCEALELLAAGHARPGVRVSVASNPEFLRESEALWDFFNPDRIVIGAEDDAVAQKVATLYPADWPLLICDRRSAELVKYAANTFLAVKISFANEVAGLCEALGAKATKVLTGIGLDHRIGESFLSPGPGFGGSCLPKDLSGFIAVASSVGSETSVARAARDVNQRARSVLVAKLEAALGSLEGARIGLLGLAFKPGTDDVRDSPAIALAHALTARGCVVTAHDPVATVAGGPFAQVQSAYLAAAGADALVVATAWPAYRDLVPERLRQMMSGHVVLDAVDVLDAVALQRAGLDLYGVGRGFQTAFAPVAWRPLEWMLDAAESTTERGPASVAAGTGR